MQNGRLVATNGLSLNANYDMTSAQVVRPHPDHVGIDLYNVFSTNTGTTFNQNFGPDGATYRQEVTILNPGFVTRHSRLPVSVRQSNRP